MGGDWIPNSFVPLPQQIWQRLSRVIRTDDWYRHVAVTRFNLNQLSLQDGRQRNLIPLTDEVIEVFQTLKENGDDSAIIFDRVFNQCWLSKKDAVQPFLDYSMEVDDQYCDATEAD
jgi:hypothetical protein